MSGEADHGLDPPNTGTGDKGGDPPPKAGAPDATQGGRTLPIGGADGGQGDVYKPEGLAAHLIGQTDRETIDRLNAAYAGSRSELAKKGQAAGVPEKADAYVFNWSDKLKGTGTIADDDVAVATFRDIALEHQFEQKHIDAIPKFFDALVDKGLIDKPIDPNRLLEDLAPATFRGSEDDRRARGAERLGQAESWIKQLTPAQGFDDAMKQEMRLLTMSNAGVKVIETLMRAGGNQSFSPGGQGGGKPAVTADVLAARTADPRNDSQSPKFDEAFALETRAMFKQLYPG